MSETVQVAAKAPATNKETQSQKVYKPELLQSMDSPVEQILFLQRTIGNQAVERLIRSGALQTKLRIGAPGAVYEHEADRVAEQVMRMPEPQIISDNKFHIQRACPKCEENELKRQPIKDDEEEEKLRKQPKEDEEEIVQAKADSDFTPEVDPDIENQIQSMKGGGNPLSEGERAFFEPRFGADFTQVRLHTDYQAAEAARGVNARAFTVGMDIAFGAGEYEEMASRGHNLMAHELAHNVQQTRSGRLQLQRSRRVTLRGRGNQSLTVVIGELRFTRQAQQDVLKYGALLPNADQAHIGFHGDRLGYDPNYSSPTDPFRWSKLKDLIDSDQSTLVQKVDIAGSIRVLFITSSQRVVIDDIMRNLGLVLPTEALIRRIYPNQTTMTASPSAGMHTVYYTTALGSPADSSMAHELFGHLWLAIKGVPFVHPKQPADIIASGTLSAQHGIRDPFGNIFTGTVQSFIDQYVGSETGMLASPTQNVGSQLLQRALTNFKTGFTSGATGTMNGPWRVPAETNLQWEIISSNYVQAPQGQMGTSGSQQTAPGTVAPAASARPAITRVSIEKDIIAWYRMLTPDQRYVFIQFLDSVQDSFQRRALLTSQLLKVLQRPKGMATGITP